MNVQIEAQGLEQVSAVLESMVARGIRLRPVMAKIGVALIASAHETFDVQGRPAWKPLSIKTILSYEEAAVQAERQTARYKRAKTEATRSKYEAARVQKDVRGAKILMRTGDLRKSISLGLVTDSEIEIGSSLPYARIHQLGGTIGPVTVKPRSKKALLIPTQNGYILRRSANVPERRIPARPFLGVHAEDVTLISRLIRQYISEGRG